MTRRELAVLVGLGAFWCFPIQAKERPRLLGVLGTTSESDPEWVAERAALLKGLRQAGWIEGDNFRVEYRLASGSPARLAAFARELAGSMILAIGAEVRALAASGKPICNLTVGDFNPTEFTIPKSLLDGVTAALEAGHTNYPPSDGVEPLRRAISEF